MVFEDLLSFKQAVHNLRLLALDVSKKHIGLAVSDHTLTIALPLKTISRSKFLNDLATIKQNFTEYNCGGLVIGNPIMLSGEEGPRSQSVKDFVKLLLEYFEVPVFLEIEQFSTRIFENVQKTTGIKSKKPLDSSSAAYFLQTLLDRW